MICCLPITSHPQLSAFLDQQLPTDAEGGIRLPSSPVPPGDDDDDVSMRDTQIPGTVRPIRPKRKGWCVCCGLEYVKYNPGVVPM